MFKKLSFFFFSYFAILGIYIIFFPKILENLGYSSLQIGVIFSTVPLVRALLPFVFVRLIELDKTTLKLSSVGLLISSLSFYFSIENFWLFLLSNIFFGFFFGALLPFGESVAIAYLKKTRYGRARLFGSIGFIVSSMFLASMLDGAMVGIHMLNICVLLCMISTLGIISYYNFQDEDASEDFGIDLLKHYGYWVGLFLIQVSFGGFYNFFTIYETSHGVSLDMVSYLWTFGVICEIALFYFQTPILKKISSIKLLEFSMLMTVSRWMLLYLFPSSLAMTFISQSLHAFSFALLHTAAFSHLQTLYKNTKLASQFYYGLIYGFGGFVGSIVAGAVFGEYVYLICALMSLIALLVFKAPSTWLKQSL